VKKKRAKWEQVEYTWIYKGPTIDATIHGYVHHPPGSVPLNTPPSIAVKYSLRATPEELDQDKKEALLLIRNALEAILKEVEREEKRK
jgi:hypothetical protein